MNGFELVARCLKAEGVEWLACFPANPLIEAVARIGIRPIVFRQERGGINAADGFSRQMAGRKHGVFLAQDGPGVENSFGGIAQAFGEAVPLLFLPQGYAAGNRDIAPNFSAVRNFAHITKLAISIDDVDQTAREIRRAFHAMRQGRPGPALVEMPKDVMARPVSEAAAAARYVPSRTLAYAPSGGDVKDAVDQLLRATRPVIWAGQGVLYAGASESLRAFAELTQIPVITTMQAKSAFPDEHPLALGSANRTAPKGVYRWLGESDVVFAIGSALTRTSFGLDIPDGKFLIHSTVSPEDINKDYQADLGLVGDAKLTLDMMLEEVRARTGSGRERDAVLLEDIAATKAEWLAEWQDVLTSDETPINPYRVVREIDQALDHANSVVTHDAGNPRDQIMPFYRASAPHGYIGWGKTTHLGYGIPLMIGAKLADPGKFCLNFMGDLAFGHTATEIETAVRASVPITTVVINNRTMGGYDEKMPVAMERYGAGNQGGDYAGMAQAMGAQGVHVSTPREIAPALAAAQRANQEGQVVVIEIATRAFTRFSQYPELLTRR